MFYIYISLSGNCPGCPLNCSGWREQSLILPWNRRPTTLWIFLALKSTQLWRRFAMSGTLQPNLSRLVLHAAVWKQEVWWLKKPLKRWMSGLASACNPKWLSPWNFTRCCGWKTTIIMGLSNPFLWTSFTLDHFNCFSDCGNCALNP